MLPPPPPPTPPPLPVSDSGKLYRNLARASWMSLVLGIGTNMMIQVSQQGVTNREVSLVRAVLFSIMAIAGVMSGIIALFGVRRHGRKGILWPALTGLGIWFLLFALAALALPTLSRARRLAAAQRPASLLPVRHIATATSQRDTELGFAFDLPEGFQPLPTASIPKVSKYAYIKPCNDGSKLILFVQPLGGTISREHIKVEDVRRSAERLVPPGAPVPSITMTTFSWRGIQLDGIVSASKIKNVDLLSFTVQIPLRKQAVQLEATGVALPDRQVRELLDQMLSSFDGETNWHDASR